MRGFSFFNKIIILYKIFYFLTFLKNFSQILSLLNIFFLSTLFIWHFFTIIACQKLSPLLFVCCSVFYIQMWVFWVLRFFSSYSYSFSFLNFHLVCVFASIWWVPVSEKTELIVKIVVHFIGYDYSNLLFDSTRFALSQLKRFKSKRLLNAPHILYVIYVHTLRLTINKCLLLAAQTPSHSPFKIRTPVVPG